MYYKIPHVRFGWVLLLCLSLLAWSGCGHNVPATVLTPTPTPAASVTSFTASASSITAGDSVTLSWATSNASSVSIDNGVGAVTGSSVTVKPSKTTTYTITATNSGGKSSQSVTVTVIAVPVIASFTVDHSTLAPATTGPFSATLTWSTNDAATVSIDNGVGTVSGTTATVAPATTTKYTLTAANSLGSNVTATVTVQVRNNLSVLAGTAYAGTDRLNYLNSMGLCDSPYYLAMDTAGNIYATDNNNQAICKITPAGEVTVLASNAGSYNYYGDTVRGPRAAIARNSANPAKSAITGLLPSHQPMSAADQSGSGTTTAPVSAGIEDPIGIAVTPDGSTIYFSDWDTASIRKITFASDGTPIISPVAGNGIWGYVDGPGAGAEFQGPYGLALDGKGNLYVADYDNCVVRKLTFASDGTATVSTLAGDHTCGIADGVGTTTAQFGFVEGITASADGLSIYVTDSINAAPPDDSRIAPQISTVWYSRIRKIATDSEGTVTVSTVAGGPQGYADGDGTTARFDELEQLALSSDGTTLYADDSGNSVLRQVVIHNDGTSAVTTLAGNRSNYYVRWDGTGKAASFVSPMGIVLDAKGNAYLSEEWGEYYAYYFGNNGSMVLRTVALASGQVSTLALDVFGNTGGSADGTGAKAGFNLPSAIAVDASGNYYVADTVNSTVRKIAIGSDGTATITTLAGTAPVYGYADGTGPAGQFVQPLGLAVDPGGDTLYVADSGNATVRKVDLASGAVTTIAGIPGQRGYADGPSGESLLYYPRGLAVDSTGLLYIVDEEYWQGVRTYDPATGATSSLALTDATSGVFYDSQPTAAVVYTSKDKTKSYLYISSPCAVFQVDLTASTPSATLVSGSRTCGYQDGAASDALFAEIWGLAVDSQGNLYVAEAENSVIRRISTDGKVTTVAGTYGSTVSTMGTLPGSLYLPLGVAVDGNDNLLVTVPNAVLTLVP